MKPIKHLLLILLSFSIILGLFAGCNKKPKTTTIRFLNSNSELDSEYKKIAKTYEKEKGIKVVVETVTESDYQSKLTKKMDTDEVPTIFQINGPSDYKNVKEYCADLSNTDLYNYLIDKSFAISTDKGVWGIPYTVNGYGFVYNDAIMNKYFKLDSKNTNYNSMEQIDNFTKFKALVEDVQANKEALGIKGTFAVTPIQLDENNKYLTCLANIPIYYESEKNNVDLTKEDVEKINFKYSDNYKNIFNLYINNSTIEPNLLNINNINNSMTEFALGQCAMVPSENSVWPQINNVEGNTVKSTDIKFLPIYIGMKDEEHQGLCIGMNNFFCINSKASKEEQKQANDFLDWLFSNDTGKEYATNLLGFTTPFNTFKDEEKPTDPLAKETINWMEKDSVKSVSLNFTLSPNDTFNNNMMKALFQYTQGTMQWSEFKDLVIEQWKSQ